MRTVWVLFRKELKEHLRTFRLLAVVGVLGVFGLATPLLLAYLPEILALSGDTGGLPIEFPDFTAADAVKSYLDTVGQIGLLTTILVAMGTIALERERGTAALVLSKPVGTEAFVVAKFLGLVVVLALGLTVGAIGCYVYTAVLLGRPDPLDYALANLLAGAYLVVVLSVTMLFSALFRNQLAAGILALAATVLASLLSGLSILSSYLPASLMQWAYGLVLDVPDNARIAALLVSAALAAACLIGAWQVLQRQEV
jgi:ABC-2 type transport system permease protein